MTEPRDPSEQATHLASARAEFMNAAGAAANSETGFDEEHRARIAATAADLADRFDRIGERNLFLPDSGRVQSVVAICRRLRTQPPRTPKKSWLANSTTL